MLQKSGSETVAQTDLATAGCVAAPVAATASTIVAETVCVTVAFKMQLKLWFHSVFTRAGQFG